MTHGSSLRHRLLPVAVALAVCSLTSACGLRISASRALADNGVLVRAQGGSRLLGGGQGAEAQGSTATSTALGTAGAGGSGGGTASGPGGGGSTGVPGSTGSIGTPGQTGPIVVCSVGDYSGLAGPPQAPMATAVQVWAKYIDNNGGLFGRQVQVIVEDDQGDPSQYDSDIQGCVQNDHVMAFVENAAALTIASGDQYLRSVNVPIIGTACANDIDDTSPVIFPQCPTVADEYYADIRNAVLNGGGTKLAFLYCQEAQTCAEGKTDLVDNGLASQAGAQIVYSAQVSLAQPDFTSECLGAEQAGATMMFVLEDPTGVERAAQSCAQQNYYPVYAQGSATVFQNTPSQPGFKSLDVSLPTFPFTSGSGAAAQLFQQVMKEYYGKAPGPAEAMGWAAAEEFQLAATKAAQMFKSITPANLIAALRTFTDETLGGLTVPLDFSSGHATPPNCWFAVKAVNGSWVTLNNGQYTCQ
jgi:branched-chain amino acid transport system substrate-binding protein